MKELSTWMRLIIKPWVLLACCAVIVLSYFYIDTSVAVYLHSLKLRTTWPFLFWITNIGKGQFYLAAFLVLAVLFRYVWRNKLWETRSWLLLICVLVPCVICIVLKTILGRARPELFFDHHLYGFYGYHVQRFYWSFPSGHTTTIISLMVGGMLIWPRCRYLFVLISLIVMTTRVLLTDHYISDVLATALLTLLELYGVLWCIRRMPYDWSVKRLINA